MYTFWIHDPLTIWTFSFTYIFINKILLCNQFFFFPFNSHTNMTYHCKKHPNFIKNGLCPWHFYDPNLLKLAVYISHLCVLGTWVNLSSRLITTVSNMAYVKGLRWRRVQFKVMRNVSLLTCAIGFKYITRIRNGEDKIFMLELEHQRNI
jgi:hypothetical protein